MYARRLAEAATVGIDRAYFERYHDKLSALWRIADAARTGELELGMEGPTESDPTPPAEPAGEANPGHFVGFGSVPPGYFDDE